MAHGQATEAALFSIQGSFNLGNIWSTPQAGKSPIERERCRGSYVVKFLDRRCTLFSGARGVTPVLPPQGEWTYELLGTGSEGYTAILFAERCIMRDRHGSRLFQYD